ncbi:hypothetical protein [Prevotella sp. OH937_COT-195]|uniref:hypothetical protein n=1 Tax=Prevotella sp. OH937_COT-195 TaxID=2491051 RepID=UPI000F647670|nr:hypothetical protein [Prevotella sp. OH937_COT-195]RRD01934.1 hypothetical protein EII32_05130 [Prevotella sp. OH937_COT-195]
MKKIAYIKPEMEIVNVQGNALMEHWSIGIDPNDPGIGPGEEDEIGAKEGFFDDEDDDLWP